MWQQEDEALFSASSGQEDWPLEAGAYGDAEEQCRWALGPRRELVEGRQALMARRSL